MCDQNNRYGVDIEFFMDIDYIYEWSTLWYTHMDDRFRFTDFWEISDRQQIASIHGNFATFLLNNKLWRRGNFLITVLKSLRSAYPCPSSSYSDLYFFLIAIFSIFSNYGDECLRVLSKSIHKLLLHFLTLQCIWKGTSKAAQSYYFKYVNIFNFFGNVNILQHLQHFQDSM